MKRIDQIAKLMLNNQLLIDIGCDHGYLGINALNQKKVKLVWNVEISAYALENCYHNYAKVNLLDQVSFWHSDGFEKLPHDYHQSATLVCAGIGSKTILKILSNVPNYVDQIILLSHTLAYELRQWATNHHWYVFNEVMVSDYNKIYELIYLVKNNHLSQLQYQNQTEFWFGLKQFYHHPSNWDHFCLYWKQQKTKLLKIPVTKLSCQQKKLLALITEQLYD
ncbi:SAM-dependent methytransferase family protein [[Mycoplasma] cavipharyngis]|uniref:tRNA (adenine(22)-N(1))-methyltransferase TrmK n=1 Tax=[Mycoplasma] cavipharyngis TaxID=92757 RepID=UPI003703B07E